MNLARRLLKAGVLSREQLGRALHRQKKYSGSLPNHLIALGLMEPGELANFIPPYPPVPQTFEEMGLPEIFLADLLLKHAFFRYTFTPREMSEALMIPGHLVELLIEHLKQLKYLDIRPRDLLDSSPGHLATEVRLALTASGNGNAAQLLEFNSYVGPVPVSLEDYWDWVLAQTIQQEEIKEARFREAFSDYVVPEPLLNEIKPAIASGRSVFLFGPSGNGKSTLARCMGEIFENPVYIPYALYVHGQIIRIFNEVIHEPAPSAPQAQGHDARWVLCRRPVVIAASEMTESALEPKYNPVSKYYDAPHQVQANNGVLIIDDFGRQRISPQNLLNRWMFPLESRQDICNLHTGQQFAVPFDQLIIFCTNLDPAVLADEAFLRRIRHKIFIGHPSYEQYLEIFRLVCKQHGLNFDAKIIQKMVNIYYLKESRPFRACDPRDLIENLIDHARALDQVPQFTYQDLDLACRSYFIKSSGPIDYDQAISA
jgi:energy-coupling factor transporter ATP-binding protein EcfA2